MIKKYGCALVVLLVLSIFASDAFAAKKAKKPAKNNKTISGCKTNFNLPNGNFIYKNSAPLRSGGVGTPLVGYRIEPTLIYNRNFGRSTTTIYGTNGVKIGSCPWASAHGHAGRARCTMNTRSLRNSARRNGGSGTGIFKIGSTCVKVPDLGRCYGSVKGLCNRLLS